MQDATLTYIIYFEVLSNLGMEYGMGWVQYSLATALHKDSEFCCCRCFLRRIIYPLL